MKKYNGVVGFLMLCAFTIPLFASAALPPGFEIETLATGLALPTSMAFTIDGRIFIAEKDGTVRVYKNGVLLPTPLIRITDINNYGDRGLIGIAVDPDFLQNGYVYLSYTYENTPGANYSGQKTGRIVRVTVVGDTASESTKVVLVGVVGGNITTPSCQNFAITADCIPSDSSSHTVGGLRFGPDGKLYATLGDGSSFDYVDTNALNAQNIDSLAGKMLRINTDGSAPSDNPFYNGDAHANRSKVYAYGFRNMFRFNFKPTGELFGGDVGWSTWEEINKIIPGGNYGWPCREGSFPTQGYNCTAQNAISPFYVYEHDASGAGSVTAGAFPSGSAYPAQYANTFFFGDYAQNWIKEMNLSAAGSFVGISDFGGDVDKTNGPVEFVTGPEGNIYFIAIYEGELKRITHTAGNRRPIVELSANPTAGLAPLSVNFSSLGTNDPDADPITYLWNFGDGSTSVGANPTHIYTVNGSYTAVLTVRDNRGGVQAKSLAIVVGNRAPSAKILSPLSGAFYVPGDTITLSGQGNDAEDGVLPDAALSWRVILHHNTHIHILEAYTGNNITITAPDHNDPSVYTEIELTAIDGGGLTNTVSVNMYLSNGGMQGGNLIVNPSFEEVDPLNPVLPRNWSVGWWGNLQPIFTYPVEGFAGPGSRAAKVEITQYTAGDAKWMFSPIFASENTVYTFSDHYLSTVPTKVFIDIGFANGSHSYIDQGTLPASMVWKEFATTFTTPLGVRNVGVYHILDRVGSLAVDDYTLVKGSGTSTGDTTAPTASITAPTSGATLSSTVNITATAIDNIGVTGVQFLIDGTVSGAEVTTTPYSYTFDSTTIANGPHTLSARARDAAGNVGTAPLLNITVNNTGGTPGTNLIANPSFENADVNGDPASWSKGNWGTNTALFTYAPTGNGGKSGQVQMTSYTDGDAKWYFTPVAVTPGKTYTFSDFYKADTDNYVTIEYTLADGTFLYQDLGAPLRTVNWTKWSATFTPPAGAVRATVFHVVAGVGTLGVDDAVLIPS